MDFYGMAAPHLYSPSATPLPRQARAGLTTWSVIRAKPPAALGHRFNAVHAIGTSGLHRRSTEPLLPLLQCFVGPRQVSAAPAAAEAEPLLRDSSNGGSGSSGLANGSVNGIGQPTVSYPTTVEELAEVVAANAPVLHLHHRERFFPCTVDWFLERARLSVMRNILLRRKVERVVVPYGQLDGAKLREAWDREAAKREPGAPKPRLQIQLRRAARTGQPDAMNDVPLYAHVRETLDLTGKRDALEVVYMTYYAFNGPYKPFGIIPTKTLGAHDSDWEHVTVRLTPDGRHVTGVYYSCHRHIDGVWRSADEVPQTPEGRPRAYVAINGHGTYPYPGVTIRLFGAFNDHTSDTGPVWAPNSCVLVTPGGAIPSVESRGSELNGTVYPALERHGIPGASSSGSTGSSSSNAGSLTVASPAERDGAGSKGGSSRGGGGSGGGGDVSEPAAASRPEASGDGGAGTATAQRVGNSSGSGGESGGSSSSGGSGGSSPLAVGRGVALRHDPCPDWLRYGGKWGSTVVAPALQEWFAGAENPVSRTWLQTVFLPLVPGVASLLEPVEEQVEDATEYMNQQMADAQKQVEEEYAHAKQSLEEYQKALMERFEELMASTRGGDGDHGDGKSSSSKGGGESGRKKE